MTARRRQLRGLWRPFALLACVGLLCVWLIRPPAPPDANAIDAKLETIIPSAEFDAIVLGDVLRSITGKTGIEFVVDQEGLKRAGVLPARGVTLKMQNVQAYRLLNEVLRHVEHVQAIGWWVIGDRVHIGPASAPPPAPKRTLRMYDVQDLLDEALHARLSRQAAYPTSAPITPDLLKSFVAQALESMVDEEIRLAWCAPTRAAIPGGTRVFPLASNPLVVDVGPSRLGSRVALVHIWSGKLIVELPPSGHRRVEELLRLLRQRPTQIASVQTYRWNLLRHEGTTRGTTRPTSEGPVNERTLRVYDVGDLLAESARASNVILGSRLLSATQSTPTGNPPNPALAPRVMYGYRSATILQPGTGFITIPLAEGRLDNAFRRLHSPDVDRFAPFFWLWADRLIVVQTREAHERFADYLEYLRKTGRFPS